MTRVETLTHPFTIQEFKKCSKVLVFDNLIRGELNNENYIKTYVYDKMRGDAYLRRDLVKMNGGKGNGCNFSNSKVSLKDVVDSINWHVDNGEEVQVYYEDMI